jgi:hypothetical protein
MRDCSIVCRAATTDFVTVRHCSSVGYRKRRSFVCQNRPSLELTVWLSLPTSDPQMELLPRSENHFTMK